MDRNDAVTFEFVEAMPKLLDPARIYISIRYRTTAHLCMCGCGEKVVHPLRPNRWSLTYDGVAVTLHPSIGNDGLACRSHYWIRANQVKWCPPLTDEQISLSRDRDAAATVPEPAPVEVTSTAPRRRRRWWHRFVGRNR